MIKASYSLGELERKQVNESSLLTRALPMQEPPGQPALTLEEREAKGGVGELVHYCILSYTLLQIANTFYDDIEICVFILYWPRPRPRPS